MPKNINARIALKRDTSANWTNYNPVLLNGELILVDTAEGQLRAKVGDGTKTYTQLPFTDEALRALITDVDNNNSAVVDTVNELKQYVDTTTENFTTEINQDINDLREEIQNGAYLPLTGGTVTGVTTFSNTTASTSTTTGAVQISGGLGVAGDVYANKVYGAVWNDYAECREATEFCEAGRAVKENGDDTISLADSRLVYGASLVSDTFGFLIGETEKAKTPIAVSGRVLAYTYENREVFRYNIGHFVCSGPHGTVSLMNKEEVWNQPEAIIGQVSAVPDYEYWENGVKVDGRVWIKVR